MEVSGWSSRIQCVHNLNNLEKDLDQLEAQFAGLDVSISSTQRQLEEAEDELKGTADLFAKCTTQIIQIRSLRMQSTSVMAEPIAVSNPLLYSVFSFLSMPEFGVVRRVSSEWRRVASSHAQFRMQCTVYLQQANPELHRTLSAVNNSRLIIMEVQNREKAAHLTRKITKAEGVMSDINEIAYIEILALLYLAGIAAGPDVSAGNPALDYP